MSIPTIQSNPVAVISPHLDDAVLSCGRLLATRPRSVVITVFAGRPPAGAGLTEWDAAAGFGPGDDVVGTRREEDRAALAVLVARPIWLDFCDSQYHRPSSLAALADAIDLALSRSGLHAACIPLGLFHSDHTLASDACLQVMRRQPALDWIAYEDALYRRIPNLVAARVAALRRAGVVAEMLAMPLQRGQAEKRSAVQHYRSQLRALQTPGRPGYTGALGQECYWRLAIATPTQMNAGPNQDRQP